MKEFILHNNILFANTDGHIYRLVKGEYIILKEYDRRGYKLISLGFNGIHKPFTIHRIIAKCFIPNPENKPIVNHKDGIKHNNIPENLEWSTSAENNLHAYRVLKHQGRGGVPKDSEKAVLQCDLSGNVIAEYKSLCEAARAIGGNQGSISMCIQGKRRKIHKGCTWKFKNAS
jgi:hypothetical protein